MQSAGSQSLEAPTTSPRSRQARPIQTVKLTITITAGGRASAKLKEAYPAARIRQGVFELTIRGQTASEVARHARVLLEKVKLATSVAKEFK